MESKPTEKLKKEHRSDWIRHYDESHAIWTNFDFKETVDLHTEECIPEDGKLFIHQFMSHSISYYMSEQNERIKLLERKLALAERKLDEAERSSSESNKLMKTVLISPSVSNEGDPPASVQSSSEPKPKPGPATEPEEEASDVDMDTQASSPPMSFTPTVSHSSPPFSSQQYSSAHRLLKTPERKISKSKSQLNLGHLNMSSDSDNDNDSDTSHSTQASISPSLMNGSKFRRRRNSSSKENKGSPSKRITAASVSVVISPKKLLLPGLDDNPINSTNLKKIKLQGNTSTSSTKSNSTSQWISVAKVPNKNLPKKQQQSKLTFTRSTSATTTSTNALDGDSDQDFCIPSKPRSKNKLPNPKRLIQTKLDTSKLFRQEDLANSDEYMGGARSSFVMETVDATLRPKIGLHSNSPGVKRKFDDRLPIDTILLDCDNSSNEDKGVQLPLRSEDAPREKIWEKELEDIKMVFGDKGFDETYFDETSQLMRAKQKAIPVPVPANLQVTPLTSKIKPKQSKISSSDLEEDPRAREQVSYRSAKNDRDVVTTIGNETMELIKGFDRLPGADSPSPNFMYKPDKAIRKKSERDKLPGVTCDMCRDYYNEIASQLNPGDITRIMNKCSRHRQKYVARNVCTPPDYWRTDFPSTEECIEKGYLHIETPDPFMDPKMKNKISRY